MSDEPRMDMVRALVRMRPDADGRLPAVESELIYNATDVERATAARVLRVAALQELGLAEPGVLDMTLRHWQAIAAAWSVVMRWDVSLDLDRWAGDALDELPLDEVARVHALLRAGRLLPPEVEEP